MNRLTDDKGVVWRRIKAPKVLQCFLDGDVVLIAEVLRGQTRDTHSGIVNDNWVKIKHADMDTWVAPNLFRTQRFQTGCHHIRARATIGKLLFYVEQKVYTQLFNP